MTITAGNRLLAGIALATVTLVTAACGASSDAKEKGPYAATASPSAGMSMTKPPSDFREVSGEGFTLAAPAGFQEKRETSSNGEPMLTLEMPSSVPAIPQQVGVVRDLHPHAPVDQQSFTLETVHSVGKEAGEVTRVQLAAPEGQQAFLVTWTETRPDTTGGSSSVQATYWQLMWQVSKELILDVVAVAPTADFADSDVSRILRSFKVSSSAHA